MRAHKTVRKRKPKYNRPQALLCVSNIVKCSTLLLELKVFAFPTCGTECVSNAEFCHRCSQQINTENALKREWAKHSTLEYDSKRGRKQYTSVLQFLFIMTLYYTMARCNV